MSTFGRRTWNKEDYIDRDLTKDHLSELDDSQLAKLKIRYTSYDNLLKENITNLNKRILTTQTSSYKKGKQFGFYCEICDLTYKDTLQFIDHLNSKPHLIKFENVFSEPLILNSVDNDDIDDETFEKLYLKLVDMFVKEKSVVLSNDNKSNLKKPKVVEPEQKDIESNRNVSKIDQVMGFSSFNSSKKKR